SAGSVVTSTRGRAGSPGEAPARGGPGGGGGRAQPAVSATTRSQDAARVEELIIARLAGRTRAPGARAPARWSAAWRKAWSRSPTGRRRPAGRRAGRGGGGGGGGSGG